MILLFDTYYFDSKAKTVCISFEDWAKEDQYEVLEETIEGIQEYVSGEFYKRELPCILSLIKGIDLNKVTLIIIDGFVYLDDHQKKGLGAYLYENLDRKIPIIGVAKRDFFAIENLREKIYRGGSQNPLFITSIGIDLDIASKLIKDMKGEYRIPTLLKTVDHLTRIE
ncbi:endonuclease V [Frigoriflavimonas asaccharolytica]|uniref:Exodeoxyribonuclease-5/deoxyribonuclease V n=1 Tax=Frigoriflavimonas asaccharolytica TaxID=2735899 RepID=A0A8J8GBA4_9FLAO|nr:endonuclease V [Frigoriflavimonas asaccharolytica]NRS93059.1 exodeoxyribonuclease-5/deoxyribonuclease V [Frigoriflavimonas asaccharolytica]